MLVLITVENGVKKAIPLTADAGAGNPVGSLLHTYKKSNPSGYLYCDGSTFDQTKYPLLYAYLGTNVLPDYREVVEVGAEQNTTDSIATHDVYTEGQFKDDQIQDHTHKTSDNNREKGTSVDTFIATNNYNPDAIQTSTGGINTGRIGTTTHGKQKAVFVYIKATSGLTENQQENVLNTINENLSYSTAEHKTGKKWIDGKDIWSATVDCGALPNATRKTVSHGIANIDRITKVECNSSTSAGLVIPIPYAPLDILGNGVGLLVDKTSIYIGTGVDRSNFTSTYCTLEYTKTTDN